MRAVNVDVEEVSRHVRGLEERPGLVTLSYSPVYHNVIAT